MALYKEIETNWGEQNSLQYNIVSYHVANSSANDLKIGDRT